MFRDISVATPWLFDLVHLSPQLALWAIICRTSGANLPDIERPTMPL